jgi:hypothetical protein
MQYVKKYVTVGAYHTPEGKTIPKFIIIDDGHKIVIDKLVTSCRAAATKVGGSGIRYTVMIRGLEKFIFEDEGKWFIEEIVQN